MYHLLKITRVTFFLKNSVVSYLLHLNPVHNTTVSNACYKGLLINKLQNDASSYIFDGYACFLKC